MPSVYGDERMSVLFKKYCDFQLFSLTLQGTQVNKNTTNKQEETYFGSITLQFSYSMNIFSLFVTKCGGI